MTAQPTWLHPQHESVVEDLSLDPVEQAIRDIAAGRPVVVVDDEDRENEGDLVIAAEMATPEIVAFMMSECRGLICAPMENDELERLELPQMVAHNTESMRTAFTVSVDASAAHGVTTGISAADRATTLRMLAGGQAGPADFVRPGHIFPLRARSGGVLVRNGHTEAAVDLARLAGLRPAGAIVEIAGEDGVMLRLPELVPFARKHGLTIISIEDLIAYRRSSEPTVRREAEVRLPTSFGEFTAYGYRSTVDGVEHVALVHGDLGDGEDILVRVHSECLTGDIFQSQRCDCGPQLHAAMGRITDEGRGVVVYLRGHEGRGIGLLSKLRAYELQEHGVDTLDANLELGLPADARDYGAGAQILKDLGVHGVRLMTNNPDKTAALVRHGLAITGREPMPVQAGEHNLRYLRTKRDRMGHDLPWLDAASVSTCGNQ
ncbi:MULTISPECIES: bifunctional 3,4-dihydroxy-2-butanone-4-phosphate synthase/GTP cyclohydrolase II [Streptomyces]|jgi:3,4-dihydroxy 2-butanone 4-phosphate synthase/GTP cyclohydrolase II|uniref:bifunctional 3,4-dihydroxy-2-butanone-4-phosphate synthase/GTP cyclohydrolase II n=1 Tax=unclassified Streptomyces TaxID=2593676 RepID=UPI0008915260|nr:MULTISPECIES: bifunctional 3,4-dihydroxy-2-butanone-4-phosphate synthase/GTP cyclohydrolase II [unclassified Streptomyces]MDX2729680.1 bifunctional 3,4-dihydroxy-2-butanone-4-phosphate synthase/GTP cyclohydrolase II [Streptomyces sp. PA03-2a]SCY96139.1 3,4-dihydroxy 2-butanone 4-phosphate synthase / GTP cyclohydrolase II [Streptomyces sp. 136MFCol5.1]SFT00441.1 3,4-dihydroxy 2-butanone 4-phosphate synthase / GTP cyclohydrolase II [Streptomyces sp. ok210]